MDLRLSVRSVADAHVTGLSEPAEPGGVDFGRRPAVEQRTDGEFADVTSCGVAVGLPTKGIRRTGVITGLSLERGACRWNLPCRAGGRVWASAGGQNNCDTKGCGAGGKAGESSTIHRNYSGTLRPQPGLLIAWPDQRAAGRLQLLWGIIRERVEVCPSKQKDLTPRKDKLPPVPRASASSGWSTIRQVSSTSLSTRCRYWVCRRISADVIAIARSQPGGRPIRSRVLLRESVAEARQELEADVQRASNSDISRRLDAPRVAAYNVEKLEFHLNRSSRTVNDLRSLRRLLLEERTREIEETRELSLSSRSPSDEHRDG